MDASPLWTLESGLATARTIENVAKDAGFHVALAGSVMYAGKSYKDLDLIVFPHHAQESLTEDMERVLYKLGFTKTQDADEVSEGWIGYTKDSKKVERWADTEGRRIDLFWLS